VYRPKKRKTDEKTIWQITGVIGLSIAFIVSFNFAEFDQFGDIKQQTNLVHRWRELKPGELLPLVSVVDDSITPTNKKLYTVKAGDTLFGIAIELGVDMLELADFNNLFPPYNLDVGEDLEY